MFYFHATLFRAPKSNCESLSKTLVPVLFRNRHRHMIFISFRFFMQDCLAWHVTVTLTAKTSGLTFLAKFRTVSFRTRITFVPWFYFFTNIEFLLSYLVTSQRVRELHTKCNRHDAAPALLNMCGQIVDMGVATGQGSCLSVLGGKSIKHDHNQMHLWMLVGSCMSGIETKRWEDFVFLLFIPSCVFAREFFHLVVMSRDILQ